MLRTRRGLLLLITMVSILIGCQSAPAPPAAPSAQEASETQGPAGSAEEPAQRGGTLSIAHPAEPYTLDSRVDPAMEGITVITQVQEGLLAKDLQTGETIPGLAESWTVSPDETVWTFNLRKGVKFHDGTEFDSKDVMFTFEFLIGERAGSIYVPQYQPFVQSLEAPDKYTFVVTMTRPWVDFESLIVNHWASKILSEDAVEKAGDAYGTPDAGPVGTGPFAYKEWIKGDHITVVRNPDYWKRELPYVDEIVYQQVPDGPIRIVNVKSGDADVAFQPPLDQLNQVVEDPDLTAACAPGNPQVMIDFNTGVSPFDNQATRQAIYYALDRAALTKSVYGEFATVAADMFPSWHWAHDPDYPGVPHDPARAQELLTEAGYSESDPLSFELITLNEAEYEDLGVLIQAQLAEVGVKVSLRPMDWSSLNAYRQTDDWKADVVRFILPSTITDDYMWKQFGAEGPLNPVRYNREGGYQHPEVEEMLLEARTSPKDEAYYLYRQLVELITEDAPKIPIAYKKNCEVASTAVMNLQVQGTDVFPMTEVRLER